MTKYNVRPLVAQEIEISTGTIISATWCRYFISITLHQCYIEATWKTRPKSNLDGHKETFNFLQEYLYSPSQVEAIIFGIPQLSPEHQDYIITGLKKHLREFIQDEEQDEDMISQYTATYNALEKWESDKRETQLFDSLAASELIRQLNK